MLKSEQGKKHMEHNKKYYVKYPWMKTLISINNRCCKSGVYYNRGIKRLITAEELKYLWFRDKAYLLKKPNIDRINSEGHYELSNCRFIEHSLNSALRKANKINFDIAQKIRKQLLDGKRPIDIARHYSITTAFIWQIRKNQWYKLQTYKEKRNIQPELFTLST